MKVFQLLMHNTEEHEYLQAHMGALHYATESQKCNQLILLPSSVSPNSPSVNSLLETQTHQFFPSAVSMLCVPLTHQK